MKNLKSLIMVIVMGMIACNNNSKQSKTDTLANAIVPTDTMQIKKPLSGKVPLENLSAKAKGYISQNYSGFTISGSVYDPLCGGGDAIDVTINKKGMPNYSLIFLPDGTFIQQEEDVNLDKAPANVLKTVSEKFANYKPANQIERLTLADKTIQYLLDISKGTATKEVIFKEDGTIVCQSKE
nr:PepSY-like domain-containing protein [Pseudopedobacter sp.]